MEWLKSFVKSKPVALVISLFVVIGGIFLFVFNKNLQIGGILGSLLGQKKTDLRATVAEDRTDAAGKSIAPGQSDANGYTQAPISTSIKAPGLFSDPSQLVIDHPVKGKQTIQLPVGVTNKDVAEVTEIDSNVYEIKNHDSSSVDTKKLLAILQ